MVTVDWLVDPVDTVTADGLSVTANPPYNDPESVIVPAKPARLFRPITAVPVEPGDMANLVTLVLSRKSGPVAEILNPSPLCRRAAVPTSASGVNPSREEVAKVRGNAEVQTCVRGVRGGWGM